MQTPVTVWPDSERIAAATVAADGRARPRVNSPGRGVATSLRDWTLSSIDSNPITPDELEDT